jgi:hypothetical protein
MTQEKKAVFILAQVLTIAFKDLFEAGGFVLF